ncbi:MAG: hypothetical protein O7H41_15240 [Planctomycetota bacterium]|nr:hypothetical protein [Planctomycetota bacterium]
MHNRTSRGIRCLVPAAIALLCACASLAPNEDGALIGHAASPATPSLLIETSSPPAAPEYQRQGEKARQVSAMAGFTASPGTFLLAAEVMYPLDSNVSTDRIRGGLSVGPLLQIGFNGNHLLLGPSLNARFTIDLPSLPRLRPYAEAGVGLLISKKKDHATFGSALIVLGGGADWMLRENLGVGARSYINIAPGPGEDFFMSFLGGVTYYF